VAKLAAKPARASVVSSFMITKGSMIEETYTVFRDWDFARSREENLRRMKETNSVGAASSNWLEDVYKVLHRRFDPDGRDRALVEIVRHGVGYEVFKPILLWHMTRDEFLVRDFFLNWLFPKLQDGVLRLRGEDLFPYLGALYRQGHIKAPWKESTLERVASGLLHMAADFGLMRGTMVREFSSYHLPEDAFLYLLHAMTAVQPNPHAVVHSPDWRLFLMESGDVERELFRLHQFRRLRYEVAGSLAELTLPCASTAAFAQEMTS
jgi:hypothetical protein